MVVSKALKNDLVRRVKLLENDLREQSEAVPDVHDRLHAEYTSAFSRQRTAASWSEWRETRITQAAVAWALGTVFVRFCEDNGLLACFYVTGPTDEAALLAEEAHEEYFRNASTTDLTDRGWLLSAFAEIGGSPAGKLLFDPDHNALYQIPISHDAARDLIHFWRSRDPQGNLVHSFVSDELDTRFLGDLYQDLSESARKTYALLQTPDFVEEFILDLTLTPAIRDFGHDAIKMIDPTCGSGHFILGTFHRLLAEWREHHPLLDDRERVRKVLDQVHGVDLNPFAVAIARFRLLIAAMRAAGFTGLAALQKNDLGPLNIATGDALLKYDQRPVPGTNQTKNPPEFTFTTEDILDHYPHILDPGQYHVVVGNPPYITVKDKSLNQRYRELYSACHRQYALSVPFAQRFFQLAIPAVRHGRDSGFVGQITANSFMKREFGRKLVEEFFQTHVDITIVVDTSGAYIPRHGTPTVILVGRNRPADPQTPVRVAMGIRGEPVAPEDPRDGVVWRAIVEQIERPGSESKWMSVAYVDRLRLMRFPLSLAGGGSMDLKEFLESTAIRKLSAIVDDMGNMLNTREDDAYLLGAVLRTRIIPSRDFGLLIEGSAIHDWNSSEGVEVIFPYADDGSSADVSAAVTQVLWPNRRLLFLRRSLSGTQEERGIPWYEYSTFSPSRYIASELIILRLVSTYPQFIRRSRNDIFSQAATVIKLPERATGDRYLELLGVLNSSTACFWLKQVCHSKGGGGIGGGIASEEWEHFYEFTGTKLQGFPLPGRLPLERGRGLDELARGLAFWSPGALVGREVPSFAGLREAREKWDSLRARMISEQEELDWEVYGLYGLVDEELTAPAGTVPELRLGERAFEIVLARSGTETQWFARHGSEPVTELPEHWTDEYRAVVEKRIALIGSDRNIGLIERPECKRRWATEGFETLREKALRSWLLDRSELRELWFHEVDGVEQPRLLTISQLADTLRRDTDVLNVAELYAPGKDLAKIVAELVDTEHVPYLAALRYKPSGLWKRGAWEDVWDRQRQEDAAGSPEEAKRIRDATPVPPKYTGADFLKPSYWSNRGKLDVPKERFISYPYAGKDGAATAKDGTLLLGWAGFDHRQQAQALATLIVEREQNDGWDAVKLTPLLAGLREVLPWVRQWHGEFDANYGMSPAEAYAAFLAQTAAQFHLTDEDLAGWRPTAAKPRTEPKPKTKRGQAEK